MSQVSGQRPPHCDAPHGAPSAAPGPGRTWDGERGWRGAGRAAGRGVGAGRRAGGVGGGICAPSLLFPETRGDGSGELGCGWGVRTLGIGDRVQGEWRAGVMGAGPSGDSGCAKLAPTTPTPNTRHTHTHTHRGVCPSGIRVLTVSAQCVNIYGGPRRGLGCLSPSRLPFPHPSQSAALPENFCPPRAAPGPSPSPPCHLVSLVFLPTPARPVPCRSDPAGAHACTRTHTHSNRVKCTYPQLPASGISLGFLQEPPNPGRLCGSLGVLAVALRPFSLRYPWRPRLPVAGRAREKSGAAGICSGATEWRAGV